MHGSRKRFPRLTKGDRVTFAYGAEEQPTFCSIEVDKKKPPSRAASRYVRCLTAEAYLSWVEMPLNVPLSVVPIAFTLAIITIEIPAAIRPYSIAVAPDSSFRNAKNMEI